MVGGHPLLIEHEVDVLNNDTDDDSYGDYDCLPIIINSCTDWQFDCLS